MSDQNVTTSKDIFSGVKDIPEIREVKESLVGKNTTEIEEMLKEAYIDYERISTDLQLKEFKLETEDERKAFSLFFNEILPKCKIQINQTRISISLWAFRKKIGKAANVDYKAGDAVNIEYITYPVYKNIKDILKQYLIEGEENHDNFYFFNQHSLITIDYFDGLEKQSAPIAIKCTVLDNALNVLSNSYDEVWSYETKTKDEFDQLKEENK